MSSQKSLEHFISLLDQYKQVAFPTHVEELSPAATFELLETVDHVKSIPDQVRIMKSRSFFSGRYSYAPFLSK